MPSHPTDVGVTGMQERVLGSVGQPSTSHGCSTHAGVSPPVPPARAAAHRGPSAARRARGRSRCHPVLAGSGSLPCHSGQCHRGRVAVASRCGCDVATQVIKEATGQWVLHPRGVSDAGMSSPTSITAEEQPQSKSWAQKGFWDGTEHPFMMPSITAKGTSGHSHGRNVVATSSHGLA